LTSGSIDPAALRGATAMIEPGTRVVQVLHDSPDPRCDGDGCSESGSDYQD